MSDNFKDTAYRMHESSGILFDKLNDKELAEKINKEINVLAEKILGMDVDGVI